MHPVDVDNNADSFYHIDTLGNKISLVEVENKIQLAQPKPYESKL